MAKRNTPLVPESRDALAKFKMQCAEEIGRLEFVKEIMTTTKVTCHLELMVNKAVL